MPVLTRRRLQLSEENRLLSAFRGHLALRVAILLQLACAACATSTPVVEDDPSAPPPPPPRAAPHPRLVLSHFYAWYGSPDGPARGWKHWNPALPHHGTTDTPQRGWYDSKDSATIAAQIGLARDAGIDGFISSWWGAHGFDDEVVALLLREAERQHFSVTILYEPARSSNQMREDLRYVLAHYATSPAWLRIDRRPVVFIYGRVTNQLRPSELASALQGLGLFSVADNMDPLKSAIVDGVETYNPAGDVDGYIAALPAQRAAFNRRGKMYCASVVPGYDDRNVNTPGMRIDRAGGTIYERLWKAAAGADCVTISTWNEWHEGTEIEPSAEYGTSYILRTRALADSWRATP